MFSVNILFNIHLEILNVMRNWFYNFDIILILYVQIFWQKNEVRIFELKTFLIKTLFLVGNLKI